MEGARRPVLPDAEGQARLGQAELLGSERVASWERVVDEGEVDAGTSRPLALALTQACGPQEDLEGDGEEREAAICRQKRRQALFRGSGPSNQLAGG